MECEKDGFTAEIALWPNRESSCDGRPLNDCPGLVDTARVTAPYE
jgi:hypothetical protein